MLDKGLHLFHHNRYTVNSENLQNWKLGLRLILYII